MATFTTKNIPSEKGSQEEARPRVLIIEDNQDGAESQRILLGLFGYDVRVAYSGPEGLEAAREWLPNAVLCDIGLPGLDGWSVAEQLRADARTFKIHLIAISGYGTAKDFRRSAEAGFEHHLKKPVDFGELLNVLASCT